jgi:hypothetical protein
MINVVYASVKFKLTMNCMEKAFTVRIFVNTVPKSPF